MGARGRKHSKYRGASLKHVAGVELRLPASTGFLLLTGSATYLPRLHLLRVVVTGTKAPSNFGPNIMERSTLPWKAATDGAGMRTHLEGVMSRMATGLQKQTSPPRDLHIEKCNVAGADISTFMEAKCSKCVCWYCELSGG